MCKNKGRNNTSLKQKEEGMWLSLEELGVFYRSDLWHCSWKMNRGCPDEKKERGLSQQKKNNITREEWIILFYRSTGCDGRKGMEEKEEQEREGKGKGGEGR